MKALFPLAFAAVLLQAMPLSPAGHTAAVPNDPDDPAIWVHPTDPARSLILGTDKMAGAGGLYVFGLDGAIRHRVMPLDRPNNVDVGYGFRVGGEELDIAVVTERLKHRLRIFAIDRQTGALRDLAPAGLPVLHGQTGEAGEPMGLALYERPRDGTVFAIVAPKTGGAANYLWQYRLDAPHGVATATLVRRFGSFSRIGDGEPGSIGEIEALVVDDAHGFVYCADERFGIRKWHADPAHPDAATELAVLGRTGYLGDREGLAIYARADGTGFLVSSDQVPGASRLMIYPRVGPAGRPHDQPLVATIPTGADSTDGLEVTAHALPGFEAGLVVMMTSGPRNFLLYRWRDVLARIGGPDAD